MPQQLLTPRPKKTAVNVIVPRIGFRIMKSRQWGDVVTFIYTHSAHGPLLDQTTPGWRNYKMPLSGVLPRKIQCIEAFGNEPIDRTVGLGLFLAPFKAESMPANITGAHLSIRISLLYRGPHSYPSQTIAHVVITLKPRGGNQTFRCSQKILVTVAGDRRSDKGHAAVSGILVADRVRNGGIQIK